MSLRIPVAGVAIRSRTFHGVGCPSQLLPAYQAGTNELDGNCSDGSSMDKDSAALKAMCEAELNAYRKVPILSFLKDKSGKKNRTWNNPLELWKLRCNHYPTLADLARKYLAIEVTSAASERTFSKASRITTHDRNRLAHDMVGDLLYVNLTLEFYEQYIQGSEFDEIGNQYFSKLKEE